ncbi:MAG: hypothetical protein AVDCRST_MAG08-2473, partial [uncultured Acetobacteraceae bacterium]
ELPTRFAVVENNPCTEKHYEQHRLACWRRGDRRRHPVLPGTAL